MKPECQDESPVKAVQIIQLNCLRTGASTTTLGVRTTAGSQGSRGISTNRRVEPKPNSKPKTANANTPLEKQPQSQNAKLKVTETGGYDNSGIVN